ncbi:MAG: creatininase family protein, partial [Cohaesibacteraceae bacterium]
FRSLRWWVRLPSSVFASGDLKNHVAVLPIGAIEQHGPHLPVGTDTHIAEAMVAAVAERLPDDAPVVFLPTVPISNSVEHTDSPGTLSLGRSLTLDVLLEIGRSIHRAGLRKMVIINAHGGNVGVMTDTIHAVRQELAMLCVATNWIRLGLPDGLMEENARKLDVHGGQLETAIMLAAHPDLVAMTEAQPVKSLQGELGERFELLRAYGPVGFGWMGSDLNEAGVVGDASAASWQDGTAIIAHQAGQMIKLLDEVVRFDPPWFTHP